MRLTHVVTGPIGHVFFFFLVLFEEVGRISLPNVVGLPLFEEVTCTKYQSHSDNTPQSEILKFYFCPAELCWHRQLVRVRGSVSLLSVIHQDKPHLNLILLKR
jgi:hypothetical protein